MKHRKLRIAWSMVWGIAAVLIVVLWVRSYWWMDTFMRPIQTGTIRLQSGCGQVCAAVLTQDLAATSHHWILQTQPTDIGSNHGWLVLLPFVDRKTPGFAGIFLPHWHLVVISAALAVLPWMRWRFSLRTLLIATTLVAVVLGLIAYATR
jgi:hypothetical protein